MESREPKAKPQDTAEEPQVLRQPADSGVTDGDVPLDDAALDGVAGGYISKRSYQSPFD